jgi:protoporphyrinogen oxidase
MLIAVLGGGLAGMTAAYCLSRKGHQVKVFEKEPILGGLASGFKKGEWQWYLDKTYHHIFANDNDILELSKRIGFSKVFFNTPETASLYEKGSLSIYPLDTPSDLLRFPLLDIVNKLRAGGVIAFLKLSPFLTLYEKKTAEDFLRKTMGDKVWFSLWEGLFRKKFGNDAEKILASFIWARIKKRTKKLGYFEGGFQAFVNRLEKINIGEGVKIVKNYEVQKILTKGKKYLIGDEAYEAVVSTLPTPVLIDAAKKILPSDYLSRLSKLKYLHSINLIIESEKPLFEKTYWLNVSVPKMPIMGLVQHTNFISKKYYDNNHILYVANYVTGEDSLLNKNSDRVFEFFLPHLKKINKDYPLSIKARHLFKNYYSQPVFDRNFLKNKPDFATPLKNFYIANLDMTYPYDRGTNYAVKIGRMVSEMI